MEEKGSPITVLAVAIFILLSIAIVAFLYFQNQQLKKLLSDYELKSNTPIPTIIAINTPEATSSATASPSAKPKKQTP